MMTWLPLLIPATVTVLWLWVPGVLVGSALRLRPTVLWGLAPLFSIAMVALSAVLAPFLGVGWGPAPAALLTLVLGAALWVPRLVRRKSATTVAPFGQGKRSRRDDAEANRGRRSQGRSLVSRATSVASLTVMAFVLSGVLMARHVMNVLDRPESMSQTFDNIYHQNAVRFILDGGSASSLDMLAMTASPGDPTFYPAAWHDLVSLVMMTLRMESIPLATNALILVVCALVWPAGVVLLSRAVLPGRLLRVGLLPAGVLAASFPPFPLFFLDFGVLYPNLLGLALLPALVVLVLRFLRLGRREGIGWPAVVIGGILGSIALSLSHPNASMSLILMVVPLATVAALREAARVLNPRTSGSWVVAAALAAFAAGVFLAARAVWPIIRPPEEALTWPPIMSTGEAIGRALTMSGAYGLPAWPLMVLILAGAYASVRHRQVALLAAWIVVVYFWLAIASWPSGEARTALVGVWYNDPMRLVGVLVIPAVPLAALGTAHLLDWAARQVRRRGPSWARAWSWSTTGALGAIALILLTQRAGWMNTAVQNASDMYQLTDDSQVLTGDEYALLEQLPDLVPGDSVIITNSWNGSSLAYALTGLDTTTKHTLEYISPEDKIVEDRLDQASEDPEVCEAVDALGATYVLDFGDQYVNAMTWDHPGFDGLEDAEGFTLIAEEGEAALYRIDACA